MAHNYGARYLKADEFIKYCADLKVKTDLRELEHYEQSGIMLPVARVIYPEEYIRLNTLRYLGVNNESPLEDQWPDIPRLFDKHRVTPAQYADLSDEELIDSFDREIGKNPYLVRPTLENYKSWDSYIISVSYGEGQKTTKSIAEHRYCYWQVHQLYFIQKYPDLYKNKYLLDHIPEEIKQRILRPNAPSRNRLQEFNGLASMFDLLSFWITVYERERKRMFALIPEEHQVKHLDSTQIQTYQDKLRADAKLVQARYGINVDVLYQFLYQLLDLYKDYRENERFKLADELRNDIIFLAHLIQILTDNDWEEIAKELGERYPFWIKRDFRHLDTLIKECDEARELLSYYAENYTDSLGKLKIPGSTRTFSSGEIDNLLEYCGREGFSVLLTALSGMVATEDEYAEKFRRVSRYTNLKNALTVLEYILRKFAIEGGNTLKKLTLNPVIRAVMKNEPWYPQFEQKTNSGVTSAGSIDQFFNHLNQLLHDPDLLQSENAYWARVFLIVSLGRNLTVHTYPNEDWFYGELFGEMLRATIYAILYTWQLAKTKGWA